MCGLVDGIDIWVGTVYALDWMVARIFVLFMGVGVVVGAFRVENTSKTGKFYGMELPRVGAFTDFGGS